MDRIIGRSAAVRLVRAVVRRPASRGFSLIEVLIAVMVLALGLLGVGAVFPVVIRSQRQSQDVVYGQIAARNAAAYITGRQYLVDAIRMLAYDTDQDGNIDPAPKFRATPWFVWSNKPSTKGGIDPLTGDMVLPHPKPPDAATITVKVPGYERLFPGVFTDGMNPQYIWDLAIRRKYEGGFQFLIVTRRIDQQIAVPEGLTLSNVLTGKNATAAQRRLATSVDAQGRPTGNGGPPGVGKYSRLRMVQINAPEMIRDGDPSLVQVRSMIDGDDGDSGAVLAYSTAIGQKLVDNLGTVYTVTGTQTDKSSKTWLRINPPLSRSAQDTVIVDGQAVELIMTPQVPVSVEVVDVAE